MSDERKPRSRLRGWWRRDAAPAPALPAPAPEPEVLVRPEETWLGQLAQDAPEGRRRDAIAGDEFLHQVDELWQSGHERPALAWLAKFIAMPATDAAQRTRLRARLVELADRRGALDEVVAHLEALCLEDDHAVRAHYLLAEHYRRRGDEARALRHYEAVLARDVAYPNVRARALRMRAQRGDETMAVPGATVIGVEPGLATAGSRYRLLSELGRGATGVVYLARDLELERNVAVKLLHPHLAAPERADALGRFFAEARVTASLRHPNIVAILDLDPVSRRIVMELAAGGTLRDVLRERGPRALRRALERHLQILSALDAAHRRGVVHRDLKPANLMFRRDPDAPGVEVMLGDFGVAHLPSDKVEPSTEAERARRQRDAVGTLAYMAPEQRKGGPVSPRADLYSAAVVLFEMLTGRYPWPPHTLLMGARRRGDFGLPTGLREAGPASLVDRLQAHLDSLGDPDLAGRPDTGEALAAAADLRDAALAAGL